MTDSTPLLNRSKVRRSQHFPRLDVSNECQYVTRSVMRQISRNLVVFMSASPCTSNYETGSYVVRVKGMTILYLLLRLLFRFLIRIASWTIYKKNSRVDILQLQG